MNPPQVDAWVSPRTLRYLGALKRQSGRSRFYVSFAQFSMIAVLFYNDSAAVQGLFPSIWSWALTLVAFGGLLMVVDYIVVFPSEITYSQGQAARENRNPTFREVRENGRKLDQLIDEQEGEA